MSNATLNRFFSLHYLLPFLLVSLAILHILALHARGSNNPLGVRADIERIPFHPYYVWKDAFGLLGFFSLVVVLVFLFPY